jgi:iron complex transport system ATP-binding protein
VSSVSISANNLTVGYGTHIVQRDMTFSLYEGEMVCMLGPNGCGKSTLLRTLAGLLPELGGSTSLSGLTRTERARRMALVLTERLTLENTSVHDVVAMGRHPYTSFLGGLTAEDDRCVAEALEAVGMSGYAGKMFNALSDGESQRVLIAKALAQQTPLILLDEPTAHLDLPNRLRILKLLYELAHGQGKTVLISTHELDLALRLSDRILLVSDHGTELDTAAALLRRDAFTAAFGMDVLHPLD